MEKTFILFSRPLLIRIEGDYYKPAYGFVVRDGWDYTSQDIEDYVGYLAGIHHWSNVPEKQAYFDIKTGSYEGPAWVDKKGRGHISKDRFVLETGRQCKEEIHLTYEIIRMEVDDELYNRCVDENYLIVNDDLYYELEKYLERQPLPEGDDLPF